MEEEIQVKIKMTSNAQVYTVKVLKSDTILTLKEKCQKETEVPPESQNLVYKGRILANEKLVSDYKIENDHTIILVKKHSPSQPSTESKPTSSNTTANTSNTNANANNTNNIILITTIVIGIIIHSWVWEEVRCLICLN